MSTAEWYRKTNWTQEERDDFFANLQACNNEFHKAQYLRIQALHLQDLATPAMLEAALELLDLMLKEAPHWSQLPVAYAQKAACLEGLGRDMEALQAYRESLAALRAFPKAHTIAPISFAMFAVLRGRTDLYDEVEAALDEFPSVATQSEEEYQLYTARALIADYRGDTPKAREYAREAINAAQKSYAARHYDRSKLSLPNKPDIGLEQRIYALAEIGK